MNKSYIISCILLMSWAIGCTPAAPAGSDRASSGPAPTSAAAPASAGPASAGEPAASAGAPSWGVEGFHAIYKGVIQVPMAIRPGGDGPSPMPVEPRVIRSAAELGSFVGMIPKEAISKTNPAPPSDDPLLKQPSIDFERHMMVVGMRGDFMHAPVIIQGVREEGGKLHIKIETPPDKDAAMMAQPHGVGAYTAVVIDRFDGEVVFE